MAGKTIGELTEATALSNTNLLAVSQDGNILKKTSLSTLENGLDASNFNNTTKSLIAGFAMPSTTYIDLTLGASGSTYTAPADGYFLIQKRTNSSSSQYLTLAAGGFSQEENATVSGNNLSLYIPVHKGAVANIGYNAGGTTERFRFYYAVGAEPEA